MPQPPTTEEIKNLQEMYLQWLAREQLHREFAQEPEQFGVPRELCTALASALNSALLRLPLQDPSDRLLAASSARWVERSWATPPDKAEKNSSE